MVNSSININIPNHISPQIIEHKNEPDIWRWKSLQVMACDRHSNVAGINPINGIPSLTLFIIGSPAIHVRSNNRLHSKRPNTITRMNDKVNIDSTMEGSVNTRG